MKRFIVSIAVSVLLLMAFAIPTFAAPPPSGCYCGGIAGFPCPDGYTCVDDPNDSCDPDAGGADCGGICVPISPSINACQGLSNAQSHASANGQSGINTAQANTGCGGSDNGGGSDDDGGGGGI